MSDRERGFHEFKWWLDHPRLYRLIGFRWMCWRYRNLGVGIPDPRPAPQEAIDLGRELARRYAVEER
jgi:hypothetical protein